MFLTNPCWLSPVPLLSFSSSRTHLMPLCWVQVPRCWSWGAAGAAPVRSSRVCPMLDTAGSSRLQRPHRRAQLSPSATGGRLGESLGKKGQNAARQPGLSEGNRVRNSPASPEGRAGGGQEVLQAPQQRCPCGPGRDPGGAGVSLQPMGRPHTGAGKRVRRKEQQRGPVMG